MDLNDMKYTDLQKLAKKLGIRANQKSDKLIEAIRAVADAGPSNLTSDDEPLETEPEAKTEAKTKRLTKTKPDRSSETTDESQAESQDEDVVVEEKPLKKNKGRRGRAPKARAPEVTTDTCTTEASTTEAEESQDERAEEEISVKPRKARGRGRGRPKKNEAVEELVQECRPRSSSRAKSPKTSTPEPPKSKTPKITPTAKAATPVERRPNSRAAAAMNTPELTVSVKNKTKKTTPPSTRTVSFSKTPRRSGTPHSTKVIRKTPGVRKSTPLVARRAGTPSGAVQKSTPVVNAKTTPTVTTKKTPPVSKKSSSSKKGTPVPARKTPVGRKSPAKKSSSTKKNHRRTASKEKIVKKEVKAESGRKRKRSEGGEKLNTTFELEDDPPEAKKARPSIGLCDVEMPSLMTSSDVNVSGDGDDVKRMIGTMRASMSKDEMKEALNAALSKSVGKKQVQMDVPSTGEKSHIPRFVTYVKNKQNTDKKPITPGNKNWSRIHKAQFEKMDSLDDYLKKRKERTDKLLHSVDKAKRTAQESHVRIQQAAGSTAKAGTKTMVAKTTRSNTENSSGGQTNKFVPTVTNVHHIQTNFSALNSKPRTPASSVRPLKSLNDSVNRPGTGRKSMAFDGDKSLLAKTPASKPVFDLKASLAKPLSWKPYTGKLKPVDGAKTMTKPTVENKREDRRQAVRQNRKDKKQDDAMRRRGIIA